MLREGPIPRFLFGLLQYAIGVLLVAVPFLLSFDSGAAKAAAIVAGLVTITVAATSEGPTSLTNTIPLAASLVIDVVLASLFVAAPFLFTFSDESSPTALFIVLGILLLLLTIGTRFQRAEAGRGRDAVAPGAADSPPAPAPVPVEPDPAPAGPALSGREEQHPDQRAEPDRDQ